jgi:hypothetical protein
MVNRFWDRYRGGGSAASIRSLQSFAERLEVKLLTRDLPEETRGMSASEIRRLLKASRASSKKLSRASKGCISTSILAAPRTASGHVTQSVTDRARRISSQNDKSRYFMLR